MHANAERRAGPDRRRNPTPMWSRHWLRGRRRGGRRDGERWNIYVDRPSTGELALTATLLSMCVVDAVWTIAHLDRGVAEGNPLMAWVWENGGALGLLGARIGIASGVAVFLLRHARFRLTRSLLPIAVVIHAALIGVHVAAEFAVRGGADV